MLTTQVSFLKSHVSPSSYHCIATYCYYSSPSLTTTCCQHLPIFPAESGPAPPQNVPRFDSSARSGHVAWTPKNRVQIWENCGKLGENPARSGKLWKSWKNLGRCRKICVPESWNSFQIWGSITLFGPRTWPKSYRMVKTKRRWCQLAKNPDFIKNHPNGEHIHHLCMMFSLKPPSTSEFFPTKKDRSSHWEYIDDLVLPCSN